MNTEFLKQAEDEAFSQRVLRYNNEPEKQRKAEEKEAILERTKILLFLLPTYRLYLDDEETSLIYEMCMGELESIVSSYRISSSTYNAYLSQVIRYRARRVRRESYEKTILEYSYASELVPYYQADFEFEDAVEEKEIPPTKHRGEYNRMDLSQLFFYIVENRNRTDYPTYSRVERRLRKELMEKLTRREVLSYILTLPEAEGEGNIRDFARVFCTDEECFHKLLELKREKIKVNGPSWENSMDLASMHWRLMCRLRASMATTESSQRYAELQTHYRRQARCHRERLKDAQNARRGMTQSELGDILGVSRTTISNGVKKTRQLLLDLQDNNTVRNEAFGL